MNHKFWLYSIILSIPFSAIAQPRATPRPTTIETETIQTGKNPTTVKVETVIKISEVDWKALLVAMAHLQKRNNYTEEQRKLENYKPWITRSSDTEVEISFLAIRRAGDEGVIGGNLPYARSTTYVISTATFEILKIYGSK